MILIKMRKKCIYNNKSNLKKKTKCDFYNIHKPQFRIYILIDNNVAKPY